MRVFDLAVSYKWKYDKGFVDLIEAQFQKEGLSTFIIESFNSSETISLLKERKLHFRVYLDRASDEDPAFLPIAKILARKKSYLINPHKEVLRSINKSLMHKKLVKKKFRLPETVIFPSYDFDPHPRIDGKILSALGTPFIIKPALLSGGGEGVLRNAESPAQILEERRKNHNENYLVQQKIYPHTLQGRRAWFRVFWVFDTVIPAWWDDITHIYYPVTEKEIAKYNLLQLYRITKRLARITKLDYFSTEIALTSDHKFYLIDYVNDQCDMRLKSRHTDGVPDEIVSKFIERMKVKVLSI
jgi:hypothetical protein